jgi:hypothetical protein
MRIAGFLPQMIAKQKQEMLHKANRKYCKVAIAVAMDVLRDYVDNIADVDLRSLGGERAVAEAIVNFGKLRSRLTEGKLAQLASLCVITGGQASFTRPDGIHVIALGHLRP